LRGVWRIKKILEKAATLNEEKYSGQPRSIFERGEWQNLFILDACRHDLYEEATGQEVDDRVTLGGHSAEYIEKTFSEGDYSNTVYVTSNPHFSPGNFRDETGREIDEVFHEVFHTYQTDWHDEENTVLPGPLIRDARTARNLFPDKKIIVHFMQPHYPFVGTEMTKGGIGEENDKLNVWWKTMIGDYSDEQTWEAYSDNLEKFLPEIKKAGRELEGKTVITADHANLVGEAGIYGHPKGVKLKELRKVPWDVIE
jgi:hypothetical protein